MKSSTCSRNRRIYWLLRASLFDQRDAPESISTIFVGQTAVLVTTLVVAVFGGCAMLFRSVSQVRFQYFDGRYCPKGSRRTLARDRCAIFIGLGTRLTSIICHCSKCTCLLVLKRYERVQHKSNLTRSRLYP